MIYIDAKMNSQLDTLQQFMNVEEPPKDPLFNPFDPVTSASKAKVIEQLHPVTKEVVRRYKSSKDASTAMQLENAKLYMRCFNHSAKSTPLGNFYWRFYSPENGISEFNEMSLNELLQLRYMGELATGDSFGGSSADNMSCRAKKRKIISGGNGAENAMDNLGYGNSDGDDDVEDSGFVASLGNSSRQRGGPSRMVEQLDAQTRQVVRR